MSDDNIFGTANPDGTPGEPTPDSLLNQLVGEGKKFASNEDLAKGKVASDSHIDNLEGQVKGLQEELEKRLTAEEQVEKMLANQPNPNSPMTPKDGGETTPSISKEELAELVRQTVDNDRTEATATANEDAANSKMRELYGDKANDVLESKAKKLGISKDFLKDVARKSPEAFYATIGLDVKAMTTPQITTGTVSPDQLVNQPVGGNAPPPGTKRWYDALRKSAPRTYWSSKVQTQLFKDRVEKGADVFNNT